jgi:hypothetical protein
MLISVYAAAEFVCESWRVTSSEISLFIVHLLTLASSMLPLSLPVRAQQLFPNGQIFVMFNTEIH